MHRTRRRTLLAIAGLTYRGPARRDAPGDDASAGSTEGGSGSTDTETGKAGDDTGDTSKTPKIDGDVDKDRVARSIAAARESEKKAKERATAAEKGRQDLIDTLAIGLGLKPDPKSDPAALAAQSAKELSAVREEAAELRTENALLRLAGKAGGDMDALRDSRGFMKALGEIDSSASNFDQMVTDAVKAAVKANPKLAATPAGQGPGRQGADHSGGGGSGKERPKSLREAFARKNS